MEPEFDHRGVGRAPSSGVADVNTNVEYSDSVETVEPRHLAGFFVGWPNPPSPETHLRLLQQSAFVAVAREVVAGNVVGFITALSDGVLSAYIPLLEVLPAFQGRGIGQTLVRRMVERLAGHYIIDLQCDPEIELFYRRFGFRRAFGMAIRNYDRQSGNNDRAPRQH